MFTDIRVAKQLITYLHENVDERCVVVLGDTLIVKAPPEVMEEVPSPWKSVYPVRVVALEQPLSQRDSDVEELTDADLIEFGDEDVQIEIEFYVED